MNIQDVRQIDSRHDMIRFFDGYSFERKEELDERQSKKPLVKSYLLETRDCNQSADLMDLPAFFSRHGVEITPIDTGLYRADQDNEPIGFIEAIRPRIVVLYSVMGVQSIDKFVHGLVLSTPEIDHVWLSGSTFNVLWKIVAKLCQPHRYVRIVFTHDSVYDIDGSPVPPQESEDHTVPEDEEALEEESTNDDLQPVRERRAARFQLVDRIRVVNEKLGLLQQTYSPLYAISQLRFPSPAGKGGHDFYDTGKVTNRSESFRDHRNHVLFVTRIYEEMLGRTEKQMWYGVQTSVAMPGEFRRLVGAPLVAEFKEHLSAPVFDYWVESTFQRQRNRFRLWGHPIRLGPTKVHVYGLDRHLWQPLFLELTAKGCVAIVPKGTCGNTVHRLVTNIQRYLDPGATFFLGDEPYAQMVEKSSREVSYVDTE